tara:strand:- start:1671 stop:1895 length:225 start_codon:yes stop_codon:yes gene_type:complete
MKKFDYIIPLEAYLISTVSAESKEEAERLISNELEGQEAHLDVGAMVSDFCDDERFQMNGYYIQKYQVSECWPD